MLRLHGLLAIVAAGSAALLSSSCGPSVQSIYEGKVRFEHCYRLDLDLEIVPTHRRHCWEQWLEAYRYGQPRDRVEYARRRLRLFATGDFERPLLHIETGKPKLGAGASGGTGVPEQTVIPGTEPTSTRSPPPSIIPGVGVEPPGPAPSALPAPGAECANDCLGTRLTCQEKTCPNAGAAGGTTGGPACPICDADYKRCMRRCFD